MKPEHQDILDKCGPLVASGNWRVPTTRGAKMVVGCPLYQAFPSVQDIVERGDANNIDGEADYGFDFEAWDKWVREGVSANLFIGKTFAIGHEIPKTGYYTQQQIVPKAMLARYMETLK